MPAARRADCRNNFPDPAFGGAETTIRTERDERCSAYMAAFPDIMIFGSFFLRA
jgi:hypothetical protein